MEKTPEQFLNDQLAACLAAMQDCLAHSRRAHDEDKYGHMRRNDVAYVAKLMKASARLTEALAKLKGDTRHAIHVTRMSEGASRSAKNNEDEDKDKDKE